MFQFLPLYIEEKIKSGAAAILADYISGLPIMIGVSIGVYALLQMFSKNLARLGVYGVFIYGGLIVLF